MCERGVYVEVRAGVWAGAAVGDAAGGSVQ